MCDCLCAMCLCAMCVRAKLGGWLACVGAIAKWQLALAQIATFFHCFKRNMSLRPTLSPLGVGHISMFCRGAKRQGRCRGAGRVSLPQRRGHRMKMR